MYLQQIVNKTCFLCKQKGHYAEYCPSKGFNKNQKAGPAGLPSSMSREDRIQTQLESIVNKEADAAMEYTD